MRIFWLCLTFFSLYHAVRILLFFFISLLSIIILTKKNLLISEEIIIPKIIIELKIKSLAFCGCQELHCMEIADCPKKKYKSTFFCKMCFTFVQKHHNFSICDSAGTEIRGRIIRMAKEKAYGWHATRALEIYRDLRNENLPSDFEDVCKCILDVRNSNWKIDDPPSQPLLDYQFVIAYLFQ